MTFEEFVETVCSILDSIADPHFISQLFLLTDYSGKFLSNYIGCLENMKASIDDIYRKLGSPFPI